MPESFGGYVVMGALVVTMILIVGSIFQSVLRAALATYRKCRNGCEWTQIEKVENRHEGQLIAVRVMMICRKCGEHKTIVFPALLKEGDLK